MTSHSFDRIKIPATFWRDLSNWGIRDTEVMLKARLPIHTFTEQVVVSAAQFFSIWQAVSELIDDPASGIVKSMKDVKTAQLPPMLLAAYHARNYREALNRMSRYKQLCAPERFHIVEEDQICTIELEYLYAEIPAPPMLTGMILAFLLEVGRLGTGQPLKAQLVEFTHSMDNIEVLEDYFGCPIRLNAPYNRLTLHHSDLDLPFISYNAELLEILTPALNLSLDEQQRLNSFPEIVKRILKHSLTGSRPDIQAVANELSMSERTLQRRLTNAGTSFKHLLNEARSEMAREYLANPSLDIKEVAFLLGYEELNSFYRAFRLWEGATPSNWRAEQLGLRGLPPLH